MLVRLIISPQGGASLFFLLAVLSGSSLAQESPSTSSSSSSAASTPLTTTTTAATARLQTAASLEDIVDIPEEDIRLEAEKQHLTLNDSFGNHKYYWSEFRLSDDYWVDLDVVNETLGSVKENSQLANAYRLASTVILTFPFPFYGRHIHNITITTGGFLNTGENDHNMLAAVNYIAPLMANFDLRQGDDARIRYSDNGTALTVEWSQIYLRSEEEEEDQEENSQEEGRRRQPSRGPYSFQTTIHADGGIVFAYKSLATSIASIQSKTHPVKVGLSDAYIIDKSVLYVSRKMIYEYHGVNLANASIVNSSAIIFRALPTCVYQRDCKACIGLREENEFNCSWCPTLQRCSDGLDRDFQSWLSHFCHLSNVSTLETCESAGRKPGDEGPTFLGGAQKDSEEEKEEKHEEEEDTSSSNSSQRKSDAAAASHIVRVDLVVILLICLLGLLVTLWAAYAYVYPHTWSGQLLIKYRPNRWHWGRSEPRYTAASIHM